MKKNQILNIIYMFECIIISVVVHSLFNHIVERKTTIVNNNLHVKYRQYFYTTYKRTNIQLLNIH